MQEAYDRYRAWEEYRRWCLQFAALMGRYGWVAYADSLRGRR